MKRSDEHAEIQVRKNSSGDPQVNFRLDPDQYELLKKRAEVLGTTPPLLARVFVKDVLAEGAEREVLAEAVASLFHQIEELRTDLALAVEALLRSAGKVERQEAKDWTDENLRKGRL